MGTLTLDNLEFETYGRLIRCVRIPVYREDYVDVPDPARIVAALCQLNPRPDLFSFWQRLPDITPSYSYHLEWDNVAAVRVQSYSDWLQRRVHSSVRTNIRKALKSGVVVRLVDFDEKLVGGIWEIFNETPIRQGRPYEHYGDSREKIWKEWIVDMDTSAFIGAFSGDELIGFMKLTFTDRYAELSGTISKLEHRDKAPMVVLIARAIEFCFEHRIPFLTYGKFEYGNKGEDSLAAFKRRMGFRKIELPRYYVPLSLRGALALHLGLHKPLRQRLPSGLVRFLVRSRSAYYSRSLNGLWGGSAERQEVEDSSKKAHDNGLIEKGRPARSVSLNSTAAPVRALSNNLLPRRKTTIEDRINPANRICPSDFIRDIVANHVAENKYPRIHTRFPPEPNGYLHIGHAKSICLNFGIAREFGGICNLRMDDTNPTKEDVEYVNSIQEDVNWLISGWADDTLGLKPKGKTPVTIASADNRDFYLTPALKSEIGNRGSEIFEPFYASDYFDQLYEYAEQLIERGKAYVCDLSAADTNAYRGAPNKPGKDSPWRNRSAKQSLALFRRMKAGEFPDGARTLRARIDMASSNIWLRDPLLYRIRHTPHHHTGGKWFIYPMYDFAHCLSDYIERITHSICTLEFEVHRPLYDWILESLDLPRPLPKQYEFAKLIPSYMVVSKRKLITLVNDRIVDGWDDPRLPTISGIRRRGVTAEALRAFAIRVGVTKYTSATDIAVYEHAIREDLNKRALRRLAVLRPVKVVITNYPEGMSEELDAINNPEHPEAGKRKLPFSRELFIERDDFAEVPPTNFFRLKLGGEVRLKYAYIMKCEEVLKDASGNITELRCTADLDSKTGGATANRKVKGTIHWVSTAHAIDAECRLYDRLFTEAEPEKDGRDFKSVLNPHSLEVVTAKCEPSLKDAKPEERYQFERLAYFCLDRDSSLGTHPSSLIFNRTITLKDSWAKEVAKLKTDNSESWIKNDRKVRPTTMS